MDRSSQSVRKPLGHRAAVAYHARTLSLPLLALTLGIAPGICAAQPTAAARDTLPARRASLATMGAVAGAYYAASLYVLGQTWYKDRAVVPFHFYNDIDVYLNMDKLGHAFGANVYSQVGYRALLNAGYSRRTALYAGATMGLVLMTPIEIMDGIHEGYGFSWGDMVANATGSALVFGQEMALGEQVVKLKFSYSESPYARNSNGYLGDDPFERFVSDYNAQTYWLSVPVRRLARPSGLPAWLNVAVGYSANGMYGERHNKTSFNGVAIPEAVRHRQYLASLDVDWSRIETRSRILRLVLNGLGPLKLPFPALEYNSQDGLRAHWLYY
jgi:hypothetical protein